MCSHASDRPSGSTTPSCVRVTSSVVRPKSNETTAERRPSRRAATRGCTWWCAKTIGCPGVMARVDPPGHAVMIRSQGDTDSKHTLISWLHGGRPRVGSTLRVLRRLACALEPVLLALLHARIARQE